MSSAVTSIRRCVLLACVLFSAFNFMVLILRSFEPSVQNFVTDEINELDGCYHVYLDLGSNIGNQVRKIYEPHLFINASLLPIFEKFFGDPTVRQKHVCAIGFEPNPHHTTVLRSLQYAYEKCGLKVTFYTTTAVAHSDGAVTFYTDENEKYFEWGGSIIESRVAKKPVGVTRTIRLADFILQKVATRQLPYRLGELDRKPSVLMKMDIEGSELEVLTDLVATGSLQHIDMTMVEYHPSSYKQNDSRADYIIGLKKSVETLTYLSQKLRLKSQINVNSLDDESYANVTFPLPDCNKAV